jgi:hypothetical protein
VQQLIAVRTRAYKGTAEIANRFPELSANKGEANNRTLLLLARELRLLPGLLTYCLINIIARFNATVGYRHKAGFWQRDETSRAVLPADSHDEGSAPGSSRVGADRSRFPLAGSSGRRW